tara:strand:- start:719 stop:4156 length:3438 start_codon:yes stop_codon:yes gene_type:complete
MSKVVINRKLPYPLLNDPMFQKKIALKKQFQMKYSAKDKNNHDTCENDLFTLAPHQEFVKTFISRYTPYNGLLLYHGMGSGKTCSVIGITEEHRKYNKFNKQFKKILIVASPNIQSNFKLQLFDPDKLKKVNGMWKLDGCVGEEFLQELSYYNMQSISKESISKLIYRKISKHYEFMGYEKFGNSIQKKMSDYKAKKTSEKIIKKQLRDQYSGRMIVVDEVHNIRMIDSNNKTGKIVANGFNILLKYVQHMKLLFLSGTPMYNNPREIVFLINILNINDKQSPLKTNDIFDKDDNLLVKDGEDVGKRLLIAKCNGYVSYVRGENPYAFPYKIFPKHFDHSKSITFMEYPTLQFNETPLDSALEHLDIYVSDLSPQQNMGYNSIIDKIEKTYNPVLPQLFEAEETNEKKVKSRSLNNTHVQTALQALIFCVYKESTNKTYIGKEALEELVQFNPNTKQFTYIGEERSFHKDIVGTYSAKIKSILQNIDDSEGIILIYSQYLDAGLVPIALALEENGFSRLSARETNLLSSKSSSQQDYKYAMITGDLKYSKSNKEELQLINASDNIDGSKCKVVLISQAGSEGIDFKHLRQVHIVDPWYNLNRIDQIIGRAIRYCSHKKLPIEKRNCQIFLHASRDPNVVERETIDMYMYRHAEQKAIKIGQVQKVLKSVSVDCLLNYEQTSFARLDEMIPITLSDGTNIDFHIGDEPYSSICDYGECGYKCLYETNDDDEIDYSSYQYNHLFRPKLIYQIKQLFQKQHVFKKSQLVEILQSNSIMLDHIHHALTYLIENEDELLLDKYMRKGRLFNVKDLYIFKPIETNTTLGIEELSKPFRSRTSHIGQEFFQQNSNTNNVVTSNSNNNRPLSAYEKAYDKVSRLYERGTKIHETQHEKQRDYYDIYASSINQFLKNYDENSNIFTKENMEKTLVYHMLECLSVKQELVLAQELLYNNKSSFTTLEKHMKAYYQSFSFQINQHLVYFVVDLKKKAKINAKLQKGLLPDYVLPYVYDDSEKKLVTMNRTMKNNIGYEDIVNSVLTLCDSLTFQDKFAFIDYSSKEETHSLKVCSTKSNRGALFSQKIPKLMKGELNTLLNPISTKYNFFDVSKKRDYGPETMCVLFEYICICLNDKNAYYLDKLHFVSYQLKKLI